MAIEKRAELVMEQARELAVQVEAWADFSNALFAPGGIIATEFPERKDRQAFIDSAHWKELHGLLAGVMKRTGLVEGATPKHAKAE